MIENMLMILLIMPFVKISLFAFMISYLSIQLNCKINIFNLMFLICLYLIFKMISEFSLIYMKYYKFLPLFKFLMLVFSLSMVLLLLSNSIFMIFLSWELLGVSSWFLIMFYQSWDSFKSSYLTMMINRLGDTFLLMSLMIYKLMLFSLVIILMASITKSAQFPFLMWLPAAMAAPLPVSALVHSSTLVTAGLYLMFMFSFNLNSFLMVLMVLMLGLTSMLLGSSMAMIEMDFKKIIAFSTLSQLGLLFIAMTTLKWGLFFFHLFNHAFVKSSLFMMSGLLMKSVNSQTLKNNGKSFSNTSQIFFILLMSLNLMSFYFSIMFISKELINYSFYMNNMMSKLVFYFFTLFSLFYMVRIIVHLMYWLNFKVYMIKEMCSYYKVLNLSYSICICFGLIYVMTLLYFHTINNFWKNVIIMYLMMVIFYFYKKSYLQLIIFYMHHFMNFMWKMFPMFKSGEIMLIQNNFLLINNYKSIYNNFFMMMVIMIFLI